MGNLGAYQWMTTAAKKVGGPIALLTIFAVGGAAVSKIGEFAVKQCIKIHNKKGETKKTSYIVTTYGESNKGLKFNVGDKYNVLESDGESVLIEKIGDKNNPYFVSAELLRDISDYQ